MVIVDHKYHQNITGMAMFTSNIQLQTMANIIINVILHDWINNVMANQSSKKSQGLIHMNIEKSIFSRKANQLFI